MKKVIGYFLFVISFLAWAAIAVLPFLNLSIEVGAAITTGLIVGGEIAFFLSIVLLGKEFLEKFKNLFRKFNFFNKYYFLFILHYYLLYSKFKNIMVLDADCTPIKNPEKLFNNYLIGNAMPCPCFSNI